MADIQIPFTTNAATAAREISALKRETEAAAKASDAAARATERQDKAIRSIVTSMRNERNEAVALNREAQRLTTTGGQLGRRMGEFRRNNPMADLGGGAGGGGPGAGRGLGRVLGLAGRVSGLPGLGAVGGLASVASSMGAAGGILLGAAAALGPAALIFHRAAVKAETASELMKAAALGHKLADDAWKAGSNAKIGNAKGAFAAQGDDLLKLIGAGGSAEEAKRLSRIGIGSSDAIAGLTTAQMIDPEQRGAAIAAAKRAAATGQGSFADYIGLIQKGQVSISGDETADVGALIGAGRGTPALNAGQVGFIEQNVGGAGLGLTQARAARGRAGAAGIDAALDTDSAINGYSDEQAALEDPFAAPREAAMASLKEAIQAMQDAADQQGAVAARFATFAAKFGLSGGSARTKANRNASAASAAAGF